MIKFKGLLALNVWFAISYIVIWNIIMGLAMYLNGGTGPIVNSASGYIASFVLLCTGVLALAIVVNENFRVILINPKRKHLYSKSPYIFIAMLTLFLCIMSAVGASNAL